jgi:fatty acid desaturase
VLMLAAAMAPESPTANVTNPVLSRTDATPSLPEGDYSFSFHRVVGQLVGADGASYREFRRSLVPRYVVVWCDIVLGYAGLAAVGGLLLAARLPNLGAGVAAALLGAIALGYAHHSLGLHLHEAAHFNIAPSRSLNDRLANWFLGLPQGITVQAYRAKHFDHHRYLGQPNDPEPHYFQPLDWRFIFTSLTGQQTVREIARLAERREGADHEPTGEAPAAALPGSGVVRKKSAKLTLLAGGLGHAGLVIVPVLCGRWIFGVAWAIGFLIWLPFFSMLREILEHRAWDARDDVDYRRVPHGAFTRLFGDGPLASTFGAAGFNRHLLHHWEPQVSYTRLRELERFLRGTQLGPVIAARQTSYPTCFMRLFVGRHQRRAG